MSSSRPGRALRGSAAVLFAFAVLAVVPALAGAATFTVNTTADQAPAVGECLGSAGDCSLRQAIDAANVAGGPNTIVLPAGTYALTIEAATPDEIENGDLNVTDQELTIRGAGARQTIVDASPIEDRVFYVEPHSGLSLLGLTVTGGFTPENGGGIDAEEAALKLKGVTVTGNVSYEEGSGGGISAEDGSLYILDSTLSANQNSGDGGAIYAEGEEAITIENSTIANNVVDTSLYPSEEHWGAYGGAMETNGGSLVIGNSTISGNQIIDGNGGEEGEGAALSDESESSEVVNTIVADNTGTAVEKTGQCTDVLESLGHNLETEEPAGEERCFAEPTDLIGNPLLAALANNGGETDTVALGAGSPAIAAANPAFCPTVDQRGFPLPTGVVCDIGAFQTAAIVPVVPSNPIVPPSSTAPPKTIAPAPKPLAPSVKVKKVVKLTKTGKAKLTLSFNEAGKVKVSGKGIKTVSRKVKTGTATLTLSTVGKAKKALTETGKAKVSTKIAFTSSAGTVVTTTRKVTFILKP